MSRIGRDRYGALYGPTTGDKLRLADTDLFLEIEEDRCVGGDEAVFGGGKTIRESMLQGTRTASEGAPDLVITNVVVLDHWGVVRCDVGIKDGRVVALGKAGNPTLRTASTRRWRSGRTRRSSPVRGGSSPRAASTATCTSSARRSWTRHWLRASRR